MKHPPLTGELAVIDAVDKDQINLSDIALPLYGVTCRHFAEAEADSDTDLNDGDQMPVFVRKDPDNWFRAVATWNSTPKTLTLTRGASKGAVGVGDAVSVSVERGQLLALDASETVSGTFADDRIHSSNVYQWLGRPSEPKGFVNRQEVDYSWDNPTRTLSLFPVAAEFTYYANSVKNVITGTVQHQIPDVTGTYWVYLDQAGAMYHVTTRDEVGIENCPVATIYWDAVEQQVIPDLFDETHQCSMSDATRDMLASTAGPVYESGMGVSALSEGSGNVDESAQFSMSSGYFWIQDIRFLVRENFLTDTHPVMWKEGPAGDWKMALTSFLGVTAGSGRLAFNEWTGSAWQLTECGQNNYALAHLFSIPGPNNPSVIMVGQNQYGSVGDARTGAETEIALLDAAGMPGGKALDVATFILQTANNYANPIKARIRATAEGEDYLDWRFNVPVAGGAASDHNALAGLQGGLPAERFHLTAQNEGLTNALHVTPGALTLDGMSEPSNPVEGASVMWRSDGGGQGNAGDMLIKAVEGGVPTTIVIGEGGGGGGVANGHIEGYGLEWLAAGGACIRATRGEVWINGSTYQDSGYITDLTGDDVAGGSFNGQADSHYFVYLYDDAGTRKLELQRGIVSSGVFTNMPVKDYTLKYYKHPTLGDNYFFIGSFITNGSGDCERFGCNVIGRIREFTTEQNAGHYFVSHQGRMATWQQAFFAPYVPSIATHLGLRAAIRMDDTSDAQILISLHSNNSLSATQVGVYNARVYAQANGGYTYFPLFWYPLNNIDSIYWSNSNIAGLATNCLNLLGADGYRYEL